MFVEQLIHQYCSTYIYDLLNLTRLNKESKKKSIGFSDDIVIYTIGKSPQEAQRSLLKIFDVMLYYFESWRLKCNEEKCETILFRPVITTKHANVWKEFRLKAKINDNEEIVLNHKILLNI